VLLREVEEAFGSKDLELLEDYPHDPRGPSALFLGFTGDGSPLHAVIGTSGPTMVIFVTLYRPHAGSWHDWRRRVRNS
jgi:hypothetical protein